MAVFTDDCPHIPLRGRRILEHKEVRQELAKRVAWIEHQIKRREIEGRPPGWFVRELKAQVLALEAYNAAFPPDEYDTIIPPADDSEPEAAE